MRMRPYPMITAALICVFTATAVPAHAASSSFTQACSQFEAAPTTEGLRQLLAMLGNEPGVTYLNSQTTSGTTDHGMSRNVEFNGKGMIRITSTNLADSSSTRARIDVLTPKSAFTSTDGGKKFTAAKGRITRPSMRSNGTFTLDGQTINMLEVDNWVDVESAGWRASATTSTPEGAGVVTSRSEVLVEAGCSDISYHRTIEHLDSDSDTPVQTGSELFTASITVALTPAGVPAIATPKVSKAKSAR